MQASLCGMQAVSCMRAAPCMAGTRGAACPAGCGSRCPGALRRGAAARPQRENGQRQQGRGGPCLQYAVHARQIQTDAAPQRRHVPLQRRPHAKGDDRAARRRRSAHDGRHLAC